MKKLFIIAMTFILLITFVSCGETVVCDGCEKEIKARQSKTKEWEGETYCLCVDCYDFLVGYENGDVIECDFCNDAIWKTDAHVSTSLGEPIYICQKCYDELKELWD